MAVKDDINIDICIEGDFNYIVIYAAFYLPR